MWKRTLAVIGIIVFVYLFSEASFVTYHEKVHYKIFEAYGCDNITIEYNPFMGGKTIPHNCTIYDYKGVNDLNLMTEIIGYHASALMYVMIYIFIGFVLLSLLLVSRFF